jgi:hypothetical protein
VIRNISVFLAALLGLWGALDLFEALKRNPQRDQYRMEEMLARYEPVSAALPANVKVIGYVSDLPYGEVRRQVLFFAAQYALAPRLISAKPDQEWVLGIMRSPGSVCQAGFVWSGIWAADWCCTGGHDEDSHLDLLDRCRRAFADWGVWTFHGRFADG